MELWYEKRSPNFAGFEMLEYLERLSNFPQECWTKTCQDRPDLFWEPILSPISPSLLLFSFHTDMTRDATL